MLASGSGEVIHGCVNNRSHVLRIAATCAKGETAISGTSRDRPARNGRTGVWSPPGPGRYRAERDGSDQAGWYPVFQMAG